MPAPLPLERAAEPEEAAPARSQPPAGSPRFRPGKPIGTGDKLAAFE